MKPSESPPLTRVKEWLGVGSKLTENWKFPARRTLPDGSIASEAGTSLPVEP